MRAGDSSTFNGDWSTSNGTAAGDWWEFAGTEASDWRTFDATWRPEELFDPCDKRPDS